MLRSIFPQKFNADFNLHQQIIAEALADIQLQWVLEVGTGSGFIAGLLLASNDYVGSDISLGLLKRAVRQFQQKHFHRADFYLSSAEKLPFQDNIFDCCLCILTLNFCADTTAVISEFKRISKSADGCCATSRFRSEIRTSQK